MVPRENKNNAFAKFWRTNRILRYFESGPWGGCAWEQHGRPRMTCVRELDPENSGSVCAGFVVDKSTVEPRLSGPRLSGLFDYPDFFSGPVFSEY